MILSVRRSAPALFLALLVISACGGGDDAKGPSEAKIAVMELDPSDQISFNYGSVDQGSFKAQIVSAINTGNKDLQIDSVSIEYTPVNSELETEPANYAFQLEFNEGEAPPFAVVPQGSGAAGSDVFYFKLKVKNLGDDLERSGYLVIESNDRNSPTYRLPIHAFSGMPNIRISPELVDFERVGVNETTTRTIDVRNTGAAELIIDRFIFTGDAVFGLVVRDAEGTEIFKVSPSEATQDPTDFPTAFVIPADQSETLTYTFTPVSEHPASATFVFFSNDPDQEAGTVVQLLGNQELPCIQVNPPQIDFGAVMPGGMQQLPVEIKNCGTSPLSITGLELTNDSSGGNYTLLIEDLFEPGASTVISEDEPFVLYGNETAIFQVQYAPHEISPVGADGNQIPDTATLVITNDSFYDVLELSVRGVCSEVICPTAIITVEEGEQVIPQTVLHVHGDQSFSPNGTIESYMWTVEQPAGSVSYLIPTPSFPNPIFEANIAGKYVFTLEVIDSTGVKSCFPAKKEVFVVPDEAIHIELLWETPNDPDPTDEGPAAGTDMDLHFAHLYASGPDIDGDGNPDPWFNDPYDVFWFNKSPDWGSFDPSIDDDPGLDRDDTDGGGPENVNLNIPEGLDATPYTYRVAVHYWDDYNYGDSFATVRVYIYSSLVFEVADVKMFNHDLWEVCTVEWPSTTIKLILDQNGQYKITPNYQNPLFTSDN